MLVNTRFTGLIFQTEIEPEEKFFQGGLEKFWKQVGFLCNKFFPLGKVKKYNDLYLIMFFFLLFVLIVSSVDVFFQCKTTIRIFNDITLREPCNSM